MRKMGAVSEVPSLQVSAYPIYLGLLNPCFHISHDKEKKGHRAVS